MRKRPLCSMILCLLLLQFVGVGWTKFRNGSLSPPEVPGSDGSRILCVGVVCRREETSDYHIYYLKQIQIASSPEHISKKKLLMIYQDKEESSQEDRIPEVSREQIEQRARAEQRVRIGNVIRITGELQIFDTATNPGMFDQQFYYQKQNILAAVWAEKIEILDGRQDIFRESLTEFRIAWKQELLRILGKRQGQVLSAILLGERREIDPELKEMYQQNGIGHILAVSGLHLSFIGIGIYQLIRRFSGSYPVGGIFGILILILYILMIGFTVSAVRALTMFLFRVGADMTGRHYDAPTALSTAAAVVLLWRPLSLYDGGFWLSFGAVFAILVVVPALQDVSIIHPVIVQRRSREMGMQNFQKQNANSISITLAVCIKTIRGYIWQGIIQGLMASIGINLVILPILLYYFFEFPLYSFLMNLFVIPLMSVLLFLGMAGSLFALWCEPVSSILFLVCGKILWIYQMSCELTLHLPGARLVMGRPDGWQIVVYYGVLFLGLFLLRHYLSEKKQEEQVVSPGNPGMRANGKIMSERTKGKEGKKWFVAFLWALGIIVLTVHFGEAGKLTAVVLDVGQGDGIFMKGPEGGTYLMDGGSSDVKKVGQYRLEPFLKSQGVGTLDYVLISHGDSDHMNGVEELIERQDVGVKIGTLVMPVQEVWDEALTGIAEKAKACGIRVAVMESGQSIREGNMAITCIQPGNPGTETENRESEVPEIRDAEERYEPGNAASMVLAVKFGEFDMLLTGDVEGEGEEQLTKQLTKQYQNCRWEILKVAHHGSKNSSSEEFLRQVKPAYALISAGRENRYGHPHQETIERLTDVGSKIYSTQENGALIVEVEDGETMKVGSY